MSDTLFYDDLVEEFGFDPLDVDDASNDDYKLASAVYDDYATGLHDWVLSLYREDFGEEARWRHGDVSSDVSGLPSGDERPQVVVEDGFQNSAGTQRADTGIQPIAALPAVPDGKREGLRRPNGATAATVLHLP